MLVPISATLRVRKQCDSIDFHPLFVHGIDGMGKKRAVIGLAGDILQITKSITTIANHYV